MVTAGTERNIEEPSSPGRGIMSDVSLDSNDDDRHHSGVGSLLRLEGGGRGVRLFVITVARPTRSPSIREPAASVAPI